MVILLYKQFLKYNSHRKHDVKCNLTPVYFFISSSLWLFTTVFLPASLPLSTSQLLAWLGIYSTTGTGADHSRTLGRMESLQLVWKRNCNTWNTCICFTVAEICSITIYSSMFQCFRPCNLAWWVYFFFVPLLIYQSDLC